jgi:hypothetical protein
LFLIEPGYPLLPALIVSGELLLLGLSILPLVALDFILLLASIGNCCPRWALLVQKDVHRLTVLSQIVIVD